MNPNQEITGLKIAPSFAVFAFAKDESVVLLLVMRSTSSFGFLEIVKRSYHKPVYYGILLISIEFT